MAGGCLEPGRRAWRRFRDSSLHSGREVAVVTAVEGEEAGADCSDRMVLRRRRRQNDTRGSSRGHVASDGRHPLLHISTWSLTARAKIDRGYRYCEKHLDATMMEDCGTGKTRDRLSSNDYVGAE